MRKGATATVIHCESRAEFRTRVSMIARYGVALIENDMHFVIPNPASL